MEGSGDNRGELDLVPFAWHDMVGEVSARLVGLEFERAARSVLDPASAVRTVYWGRNYLYEAALETPEGLRPVVVKQFRNQGWRRRLDRRLRGSKATRAWRATKALIDAGFQTPELILLAESNEAEGSSYLVTALLEPAYEIRQFFRHLNGEADAGYFPDVDHLEFLRRLGALARALHDAGIWYRDLSLGNILAHPKDSLELQLVLVDCNRARVGVRLGIWRRSRDICRLPVLEREHRQAFLTGYWGKIPPRWSPRWWLYTASVRSNILKHQVKNAIRGRGKNTNLPAGGTHHAHIPNAPPEAALRDQVVWDVLSDQPHQHASKWQKTRIRLADGPAHIRDFASVAASLPAVWRRFGQIKRGLFSKPVPFKGIGLAVRPFPDNPEAHFEAVLDTGVQHVLLRLHPWAGGHDDEERLAAALVEKGVDLVFSVPQNRELVRDLPRWRASVEELGERFSPYSKDFVIGHAVNRSKWGVWTSREYVRLYHEAVAALDRFPGIRISGPGVIDFEFQSTLVYLRRADLDFEAVASLLYVDRRGAPENQQLGLDTMGKIMLLRAICDVSGRSAAQSWITEVNWPLWEGPHSPAGRAVSVNEETQAAYLTRYYVQSLGTGLVDRVYWWRLLARGYGLATIEPDGVIRRRPSYDALKTLVAELDGASSTGPAVSPDGAYLWQFQRQEARIVVGWSLDSGVEATLPFVPLSAVDRGGKPLAVGSGHDVVLGPSPTYFRME